MTSQLQLIDEQHSFNPDLPVTMEEWQLLDAAFDYKVVAVFGSQSTGKSTLLNKLFGTCFDVMNEDIRKQTTRGIWLSKAQDSPLLVLDVEGTDGRERGEDQEFERRSALFSLAVANVIIINMWENMVGLYNGANLGLLKTVLEVNLQLFQYKGSPRTMLLFVIRDHIGRTPLENLANTLQTDMENIWAGLSKSEEVQDASIHDFFDLSFTSLPHKLLCPQEFDEQASNLSQRFYNSLNEDYIFSSSYDRDIPADGFPRYAEDIWAKIMDNRDLDIPTQQQLLAQYRCDEIATVAFEAFSQDIEDLFVTTNGTILEDLGDRMRNSRNTAIESFKHQGSRYHKDVYRKKLKEFNSKLNQTLHQFFLAQLASLSKQASYNFTSELKKEYPGKRFSNVLEEILNQTLHNFQELAKDIQLSNTSWTIEPAVNELTQLMIELGNKIKLTKFTSAVQKIEVSSVMAKCLDNLTLNSNNKKKTKEIFQDQLGGIMSEAKLDMWQEICGIYIKAVKSTEKSFESAARDYGLCDEESTSLKEEMLERCWNQFRDKLQEESSDNLMLMRMRNRFEEHFRYDSQGIPRVWKPEDDMDTIFRKAKAEADAVLSLFSKIDIDLEELRIPDSLKESNKLVLQLLSQKKYSTLHHSFKREADAMFLEAKRSTVATMDKIPPWVMVLIAFLGWNEFITILKSPVYLFLTLIIGGGLYFLYMTQLLKPAMSVLTTVSKEAMKVAVDKFQEISAPPLQSKPVKAAISTEDTIEMEMLKNSTTSMNSLNSSKTKLYGSKDHFEGSVDTSISRESLNSISRRSASPSRKESPSKGRKSPTKLSSVKQRTNIGKLED